MTAPTDLRAALRDKLIAAYDAAWDTTGEGKNAEYTGPRYTQDAYERERAEAIDKILADAPPTVAELLPMVDATHEVHWTDEDGMCWRIVARSFGASGGLGVETQDPDSLRWMAHTLFLPDIIKFHACLVEVAP